MAEGIDVEGLKFFVYIDSDFVTDNPKDLFNYVMENFHRRDLKYQAGLLKVFNAQELGAAISFFDYPGPDFRSFIPSKVLENLNNILK